MQEFAGTAGCRQGITLPAAPWLVNGWHSSTRTGTEDQQQRIADKLTGFAQQFATGWQQLHRPLTAAQPRAAGDAVGGSWKNDLAALLGYNSPRHIHTCLKTDCAIPRPFMVRVCLQQMIEQRLRLLDHAVRVITGREIPAPPR